MNCSQASTSGGSRESGWTRLLLPLLAGIFVLVLSMTTPMAVRRTVDRYYDFDIWRRSVVDMAESYGGSHDEWMQPLSEVSQHQYDRLRRAIGLAIDRDPSSVDSVPQQWRDAYSLVLVGHDGPGIAAAMTAFQNLQGRPLEEIENLVHEVVEYRRLPLIDGQAPMDLPEPEVAQNENGFGVGVDDESAPMDEPEPEDAQNENHQGVGVGNDQAGMNEPPPDLAALASIVTRLQAQVNDLQAAADENARLHQAHDQLHQENQRVLAAHEQLHRDNQQLHQDYQDLRRDNQRLRQDSDLIRQDNQQLSQDCERLQEANSQVRSYYERVRQENDQAFGVNDRLHQENQRVLGENEQLRQNHQQARADVDRVLAANGRLSQDVQRLVADNEQLRGDIQQLRADNNQLREDSQRTLAVNEQLRQEFQRVRAENQHLRQVIQLILQDNPILANNEQLRQAMDRIAAENNRQHMDIQLLRTENHRAHSNAAMFFRMSERAAAQYQGLLAENRRLREQLTAVVQRFGDRIGMLEDYMGRIFPDGYYHPDERARRHEEFERGVQRNVEVNDDDDEDESADHHSLESGSDRFLSASEPSGGDDAESDEDHSLHNSESATESGAGSDIGHLGEQVGVNGRAQSSDEREHVSESVDAWADRLLAGLDSSVRPPEHLVDGGYEYGTGGEGDCEDNDGEEDDDDSDF